MSEKQDRKGAAPRFGRRSALALGALSAAALLSSLAGTARAQSNGGIKLTILIGPPKDPAAFEKYYLNTHIPLVAKTPSLKRMEIARVLPPPPPDPTPPYYRINELYFENIEGLQTGLGSPEWKAVVADVPNFADPSSIIGFASALGA